MSVIIEVGVLVALFVLFGCAMGVGMLVHARRRKKRKVQRWVMNDPLLKKDHAGLLVVRVNPNRLERKSTGQGVV